MAANGSVPQWGALVLAATFVQGVVGETAAWIGRPEATNKRLVGGSGDSLLQFIMMLVRILG